MKNLMLMLGVLGLLGYAIISENNFDSEKVTKIRSVSMRLIYESHNEKWPSDVDIEAECVCEGDGVVHHADGHTTPCPAIPYGKCKSQLDGQQIGEEL